MAVRFFSEISLRPVDNCNVLHCATQAALRMLAAFGDGADVVKRGNVPCFMI
jgi:hypothetical protein